VSGALGVKFSNQKSYCRTCGAGVYGPLVGPGQIGFCSIDCLNEFQWRTTLSVMGKEYYQKNFNNKN